MCIVNVVYNSDSNTGRVHSKFQALSMFHVCCYSDLPIVNFLNHDLNSFVRPVFTYLQVNREVQRIITQARINNINILHAFFACIVLDLTSHEMFKIKNN